MTEKHDDVLGVTLSVDKDEMPSLFRRTFRLWTIMDNFQMSLVVLQGALLRALPRVLQGELQRVLPRALLGPLPGPLPAALPGMLPGALPSALPGALPGCCRGCYRFEKNSTGTDVLSDSLVRGACRAMKPPYIHSFSVR